MNYHTSVLLEQSVDLLNIRNNAVYVDATFGGGGHSREILKRMKNGRLIAIDQDADAHKNVIDDDRFELHRGNFRFIKNYLRFTNALPVDGILADFGLSSHQIDEAERGFSFSKDADLDMRMNRNASRSAIDILNDAEIDELVKIFRDFGEVNNAYQLSQAIIKARGNARICTTSDLQKIAAKFARPGKENKFLAKVFQALRIEVNDEMGALREFLNRSFESLKENGRLVLISYHSLEDRMVKDFFREEIQTNSVEHQLMGHRTTKWNVITRKPLVPDEAEQEKNPRSRSAKLRAAEKAIPQEKGGRRD
ncbi:MAG: 16S rRNA (cytosine(1402)-N(4))-methyltransferase [Marinilabiliales bacterium]|nr:MAG: 16S rRNA (cytosine(1402)-N(4))-methyltransferase [Marinilabiliales bacterium]